VKGGPEFDWDEQNENHLAKHGISRSGAEDVLSGNHILLEYQMEENEQRWVAVGALASAAYWTLCSQSGARQFVQ
jgi:uncharacterized DUF497 family protein